MRRRSPGEALWLVSLAVLQAGSWFAMFASNRSWLGSWRMALDWTAGSVIIEGPLLSGLVAMTYAGWGLSALPELVQASARPVSSRFGPACRMWGAAVVSMLAVAVVVTVRSLVGDAPVESGQFVILVPAVLMLAVHGMIGMLVGLRLGPRAAPLVAAVTSFALFLLATRDLAPPSFVTGGATGSLIGEQYQPRAVLLLAGFAVALVLALIPWVQPGSRSWRYRSVAGAAAFGLAAGLATLGWPDLDDRFEPAAVSYRCDGYQPEVCVAADTVHILQDASRRMGRLAKPLLRVGVRLPRRWVHVQALQPTDPGAGALLVPLEAEWGGRIGDVDLVRSLAMPASCKHFYDGSEPPASADARVLLAQWISVNNGLESGGHRAAWFASASAAAWVRTTYAQVQRCALDALHVP